MYQKMIRVQYCQRIGCKKEADYKYKLGHTSFMFFCREHMELIKNEEMEAKKYETNHG